MNYHAYRAELALSLSRVGTILGVRCELRTANCKPVAGSDAEADPHGLFGTLNDH